MTLGSYSNSLSLSVTSDSGETSRLRRICPWRNTINRMPFFDYRPASPSILELEEQDS